MNKNFYSKASLGILVVGFLAFVTVINLFFSWARFDLTEDNLYSVSKGSKNIVSKIDEPITLNFFFSKKVVKDQKELLVLQNYAKRVKEFLDEYVLLADGMINLKVIDPEPFSEAEDQANEFGLTAVPVQSGEQLYFGLVGTNSVDQVEKIGFFEMGKEQFLEYDISKLIYKLLNNKKPVVGLLSGLPVNGGMDMAQRQPQQPWVIFQQAQQLFEIRELEASLDEVDQDIDLLMLVHPKGLTQSAKYAIDQYVLAGGKTMIFVDPNAEQDRVPQSPQNPFPQTMKGDNLNDLFKAWGFTLPMDKVVGDRLAGAEVGSGRGQTVKHVGILDLQQDNLDKDDVVLANLERVILSTPGHLMPVDGAETTLVPLIQSTTEAKLFEASQFFFLPDPSSLLRNFQASGEKYTIAARISGKAKTAFIDGRPTADKAESSGESDVTKTHLSESTNGINVLVFADSDMLANQYWVRVQQFLGSQIAQSFADNGDMILNSIENMAGSSDLIGLRGRGRYTRPFDKVEELKLAAEEKFRRKEQELQERLNETERQLNQLTAQVDESGRIMLSPEQERTIEQFQQQKLSIRKQLREVQHQLEKDINSLGNKLKAINIGLVPLILILVAIATAASRRSKRKRARAHQ